MSVDVLLQTLNGNKFGQVYDVDNMLTKIWPIGNPGFPLLQYIELYGDAFFNGSQMSQIIMELHSLMEKATSDAQRRLLQEVVALAQKCESEPHTFLRFLGD